MRNPFRKRIPKQSVYAPVPQQDERAVALVQEIGRTLAAYTQATDPQTRDALRQQVQEQAEVFAHAYPNKYLETHARIGLALGMLGED